MPGFLPLDIDTHEIGIAHSTELLLLMYNEAPLPKLRYSNVGLVNFPCGSSETIEGSGHPTRSMLTLAKYDVILQFFGLMLVYSPNLLTYMYPDEFER